MTTEVILEHVRPVRAHPPVNKLPVYRTMFYTLDISSRFLANAAVGNGTVACADRLIDSYWRRILMSGNARLLAEGREHFDGRAMIVMSNHTSILDIPSLMGAIPGSMRMVLKQELTRIPVWGPALVGSGFVPVERGSKKAREQIDAAKQTFDKGVHIWVAPEGTRSRDGSLLPFKKGGFHLAQKLGAPIVPTWIDGAAAIVPADGFDVHYDGQVLVKFGAPIAPRADGDVEKLAADVRAAMLRLGGRPAEAQRAVAA
jgi:1-acyl-sn-glycerol-3-phosphate acyltransferase